MSPQIFFLVRSWNCFPYLIRCLYSIHTQRSKDFTVLFVDDASPYTAKQKNHIRSLLRGHIVQFNKVRKYAARNAYEAIHTYVDRDDAIIINLDGDDWLESKNVPTVISRIYKNTGCLLTYGNCRFYEPNSMSHNVSAASYGFNQRYAKNIEADNAYRQERFIPLHVRTWRAGLFKKIQRKSFLRPDGSWQRTCEDEAMFFPMLEMAHGRYEVLTEAMYVYNRENAYNDEKVDRAELLFDEAWIRRSKPYMPITYE